jgi:hypothetical protein
MPKLQGTAMDLLVEGDKLQRADILVTRTKCSLLGWLIRKGTGSDWNHALMIYVIRDKNQGYNKTFIIESGGAGIDIHNISHYFEKPNKYDAAILRWEPDWLKDDFQEKLRYCRTIRGFALEEIDDKYNHRMIFEIGRRLLRQIILGFLFPWQRRKPPEQRAIRVPEFIKRLDINAYICSGFVQWAYYQCVWRILKEDAKDDSEHTVILKKNPLADSRLQQAVFNPRLTGDVSDDDLLSTTPADLANSDKLSWKYIVRNGEVYEVSSKKEADEIMRQ